MNDDEKRAALLHEIQAWREAWTASEPGSPQYQEFQNKMKKAEWELRRLGPSQDLPGLVISVVGSEQPER